MKHYMKKVEIEMEQELATLQIGMKRDADEQ